MTEHAQLENPASRVVTLIVERHVKPDSKEAYEELLRNLLATLATFAGYLGANVIKPAAPADTLYRIVVRFDSQENLQRWTDSAEREKWMRCLAAVSLGEPDFTVLTGLETWFAPRPQTAFVPPPRYKMALVTLLASYPLVTLLTMLFEPELGHLHAGWRILPISICLVLLMTFVVMPLMTRLFRRWLYPKP